MTQTLTNEQETARENGTDRRSRLEPAESRPRFHPFQRAWKLEACQLYWVPVETFPMAFRQRQWHLRLTELLAERLKQKSQLVPEHFLQMKTVMPTYRDVFIKTSHDFHPIFGLGRYPGRPLPAIPDEEWAKQLGKGQVQYDHKALQPDYSYWFLEKRSRAQTDLFLGSGGFTTLFLTPGEDAPKPPKMDLRGVHDPKLRAMAESGDTERMMQTLHSMESPFLKQSKLMFASDLAEDPQYPGLLFCLPLLRAQDFFAATPKDLEAWFGLFKVYLRESPEDGGCLLASSEDLAPDLDELLETVRQELGAYPV